MKELVRYLLDNMYVDFQGEISLDTVRQFLRGDDSREAKQLLQKLIEDKGVDDLLITLADVLKDHVRTGVNDQVMKEQLVMYADKFHSKTDPPVFVTAGSYAASIRQFGEDKAAVFGSLRERFGEPDLTPFLDEYGHALA